MWSFVSACSSFCNHLLSTDFFQFLTATKKKAHIQTITGWSLFKERHIFMSWKQIAADAEHPPSHMCLWKGCHRERWVNKIQLLTCSWFLLDQGSSKTFDLQLQSSIKATWKTKQNKSPADFTVGRELWEYEKPLLKIISVSSHWLLRLQFGLRLI